MNEIQMDAYRTYLFSTSTQALAHGGFAAFVAFAPQPGPPVGRLTRIPLPGRFESASLGHRVARRWFMTLADQAHLAADDSFGLPPEAHAEESREMPR